MSSDLDLFPDHPQTHCKHGTWLKEDICLSCQQEHDQAIRDDERDKIAGWLDATGKNLMVAATHEKKIVFAGMVSRGEGRLVAALELRNNEHREEG